MSRFSRESKRPRTFREVLTANRSALDDMARMTGKPRVPQSQVEAGMRPKRVAKPRDPRKIYERDVLKAAMKYLRHHPKVATVERTQSGVFREGNRTIRVGFVGKLDISGTLKGGRAFEFEAKRPGGRLSRAQALRIAALEWNGVLTGWFDSVEALQKLMDGA